MVRVGLILSIATLAAAKEVSPPAKSELNVITEVRTSAEGAVAVEIVGSRKPSFTTFSMTNPPRLVIDVAEAVFRDVPSEQRVENAAVSSIKIAGFGSDQSSIARVVIGLAGDFETDIQTVGDTTLVVRIGGTMPLVRERQRKVAEEKAAKEAAAEAAQEKKRLAEEERQRKVAEEKAAKEAAAAAAQEKKRLAEEERQRKVAEAKAAKEAAAAAAQEKRRLVEERRRKVAEEKAAKEAAAAHERKLLADKDLQGSHLAQAAAKAVVRIASQEVGAAANAQRESRRSNPAPDRERGSIESIGFRQVPEGTRVFVRTTTAVPFAVHGEPERVILELHARIGHRNNRRMLDTRFFDSPVAFVAPEVVGDAVRIAIKLKEQVPYAARREGNEIVVEFQRR